jgi:hypothetical protein
MGTRVLIPSGALGPGYDKAALDRAVAAKPSLIAQTPLSPLSVAPQVDANTIKYCTHIVALAGAEQIKTALNASADIIIAGRTTDTAIITALPLKNTNHAGGAWHGAKISECGALCATNPQSGVILVDFDDTGFTLTPMADGQRRPRTRFRRICCTKTLTRLSCSTRVVIWTSRRRHILRLMMLLFA